MRIIDLVDELEQVPLGNIIDIKLDSIQIKRLCDILQEENVFDFREDEHVVQFLHPLTGNWLIDICDDS